MYLVFTDPEADFVGTHLNSLHKAECIIDRFRTSEAKGLAFVEAL